MNIGSGSDIASSDKRLNTACEVLNSVTPYAGTPDLWNAVRRLLDYTEEEKRSSGQIKRDLHRLGLTPR